jgi:hypothetical protein
MYTIVDLNNVFENIVSQHQQLKSFYTHGLDELDVDKLDVNKYPLLYAQCTDAELNSGFTVLTYEVIVGDLVIEKQEPYLTEVYSETFLILQDVVSKFWFAVYDGNTTVASDISFDLPITCQPFTARFTNMLSGWSCSFDIRLPNPLNLCDAPF